MPFGDGTGPDGLGPATGWGRGPCGRGLRRGYAGGYGRGRGFGRGYGYGRGYGRGYGWGYRGYGWGYRGYGWNLSKEDELAVLKDEQKYAEEDLSYIKNRIDELEKDK
jgi:hypothetical protein